MSYVFKEVFANFRFLEGCFVLKCAREDIVLGPGCRPLYGYYACRTPGNPTEMGLRYEMQHPV